MQSLGVVAAAAVYCLVGAVPFPQDSYSSEMTASFTATSVSEVPSASVPPTVQNPCAAISQLYSDNSEVALKVPAKLAYDCLNDVPINVQDASAWLQSISPYFEWQSTTAYLKNPPEGYLQPAADIWGGYQSIVAGLSDGRFANEYELEFELYRLFQTTYDGHFRYTPNMLGIFAYARPISLVSYSIDGSDAPKAYVYADVLSYFVNSTAEPSAVTEIDGQDATEFLESWSQYGSLQDPDALYNNVFYSLAQATRGATGSGAGTFAGGGRGAYIYPGPTTILSFENGTSATFDNFARVLVPFGSIDNGTILYRTYIQPGTPTASAPTTSSTPRPGYPDPVLIQQNNNIGGYYLDEPGYEDVAVLSVSSFVGAPDFQDVAYRFLEQATQAGKTRLVIDVSANGGGTILQGYNLFLNLFPDILPYGGSRFRSHEAFDVIGQIASDQITQYPFNYSSPPNPVWLDFAGGSPFNYRQNVDVNYEDFDSWRDVNPPNRFYGDNFTNIIRWNLSDPLNEPINRVQVNGFGNRTGLPPSRPFEPENIVILYDGYCASTCAIFSEFMTQQAGIKTVSIGGRPNENEAMQTVGGVKGTNNYPWAFIQLLAYDTYTLAPNQSAFLNSTALYSYRNSPTNELPFVRALANSGQVNVRDGIRQGDPAQTPLQFVYEPANCRLWYTAEMTVDVTAQWEKVVDVTWGGGQCAQGGFDGGANTAERQEAKENAEKRLRKRLQQMTGARAAVLEQALELYTDMYLEPMQGLMLP